MESIEVLENVIKEYSWGSYSTIAELLGKTIPSINPQAELWMGSHPSASSTITINNEKVSLFDLVHKYPLDILGKSVVKKFGSSLPFLFKILAAEKPLSIQVHPNSRQAKEGFEKENEKQIPLDSARRNYKDSNHKPEYICALTDFWALNGFRRISDIISFIEKLNGKILEREISQLKKNTTVTGLKNFFKALMLFHSEKKERLIDSVVLNAEKKVDIDSTYRWIIELHKEYGKDIGVLSPLFLNLIYLKPGEAMFIASGELHAYLKGTGIELMANSDNVIRGGLTPKHVDISELFRIVNFEQKTVNVFVPDHTKKTEIQYPCVAKEFVLSKIHVRKKAEYMSPKNRSVELMICVDGRAAIYDETSQKETILKKGTSILIPAAVNMYSIKGEGIFYKATVPL